MHLEVNRRLLEDIVPIHRQADGHGLLIVPNHFVVFDWSFWCSAMVLRGCRGREMPFDIACPGYKGHIIEVEDLYPSFRSVS